MAEGLRAQLGEVAAQHNPPAGRERHRVDRGIGRIGSRIKGVIHGAIGVEPRDPQPRDSIDGGEFPGDYYLAIRLNHEALHRAADAGA